MNECKLSWRMEYLYSFKVPPLKICVNYQEKRSSFTLGEPGDITLIKWSKWVSPATGTNWNYVPCDKMQQANNTASGIFRRTMPNLNLIMREQQKTKSERYSKKKAYNLLEFKVIWVKGKTRNGPIMKETNKTWQLLWL